MLGRSASTVSREFRRNTLSEAAYALHSAQVFSHGRRQASRPVVKPDLRGVTWGTVVTLLDWKVVAPANRRYPQPCVSRRVRAPHMSHETIYTAIYAQPRGELRRLLIACLRQGRSTRMPHYKNPQWQQ